ncbi:hypothetical protein JRQ81_009040 [Phrynocephalus forsythii]|uniref:Uncharacterized protein n=1 Tax=Phrynocephalus forsythii TaxID=171643 RepID=A0A9Q0XBN3_9SAUR|nr:hypothetical protein JRQ81_009040 [Phrynocephalus forsythii]
MEPAVSPAQAKRVSPPRVGGSWGKAQRIQDPVGSSPPATPAPHPGSGHLAQKRQGLQKNARQDEKLQQLKARIQQQQQRSLLRALREHSRTLVSNSAESPPRLQPHLKRKVCKISFVSSPAAHAGWRGRGAEKKARDGTSTLALPEKAPKEQVVCSVDAFSWREGQKLARKILGPRLKYQKPSSCCEQEGGQVTPEPKRDGTTCEAQQGIGENEPALKRVRGQVTQERKGKRTLIDKESPLGSKNRARGPRTTLL